MILAIAVLLATAPARAPDMAGIWDLKIGDTTIFRLQVVATPAGTTASLARPKHFETDGESFSHLVGPPSRRQAQTVRSIDGDLEVGFDDPAPNSTPDIFRLHRIDVDHVDVTYAGTGFDAFNFVRATLPVAALGGWDAGRTYIRTITRLTNIEMTAIFDADQVDRSAQSINWTVVGPADNQRRKRTETLLDNGALQSGDDFYHAAFVFQHGDAPNDFLKAHLLAMIATARGKTAAVWIAAATLDRYLQASGQPQVLGTQFKTPKDAPITQEPYNRRLVSDAMRKALHVPPVADQEGQRRELEREAAAVKPLN